MPIFLNVREKQAPVKQQIFYRHSSTGEQKMICHGFVYILSNPAFTGDLFKIGMTTRSARTRAWELYRDATGVPSPFIVEFEIAVSDCARAEQKIHQQLLEYRDNIYREFFRISLDLAKATVTKICAAVDGFTRDDDIASIKFVTVQAVHVNCTRCHSFYQVTLTRYESSSFCLECGFYNTVMVRW